jgi:hypothetical protein
MSSVPARSEVFVKLIDLIDQLINQTAIMAHLHRTEGGAKDRKLALGWLMMSEAFKAVRHKVVELGQGRLN